jgi:MoxR-like ATPase
MSDREREASAFADVDEAAIRRVFDEQDYVAGDDVVTTVLLSLRLGKPLLLEGEPGSGKTELGKVLADGFDTDLVRLQCYEGLTAEETLYEWNYAKQLLSVQAGTRGVEADGQGGVDGGGTDDAGSVFSEEFLLERPLLRALDHDGERPPVLLIDEIDRADEEFEALLLEVLSEFQVSIPELGTVSATQPPIVVITSNRTRGLSDALKRRCLYQYIRPPSVEKEREIVRRKVPELDGAVAGQLCSAVARLREEPLLKQPGAAETLDWARAVATLDGAELTEATVRNTLGTLLKEVEDVERVDDELVRAVFEAAVSEE